MTTLAFFFFFLTILSPSLSEEIVSWDWTNKIAATKELTNLKVRNFANNNIAIIGRFSGLLSYGGSNFFASINSTVFYAVLDQQGSPIVISGFGSIPTDRPDLDLDVDNAGNIYITGSFKEIANFGTIVVSSLGLHDAFLVILNSTYHFVTAEAYGGPGNQYGLGVRVSSGGVYLTMATEGVLTFGGNMYVSGGQLDVFVAQLTPNLAPFWGFFFGGAAIEEPTSLALDSTENVYLTGFFRSSSISISTTVLIRSGVDQSIFVAKFSNLGDLVWAQSLDSNGFTRGLSIVHDTNSVYITGLFNGYLSDFLFTNATSQDTFVYQLHEDGTFLNARTVISDNPSNTLLVTAFNTNFYLAGVYTGSIGMGGNNYNPTSPDNMLVAKLTGTNNVTWANLVTGGGVLNSGVYVTSIAVDLLDRLVVVGNYEGNPTFDGTPTLPTSTNRTTSAFVARGRSATATTGLYSNSDSGLTTGLRPFVTTGTGTTGFTAAGSSTISVTTGTGGPDPSSTTGISATTIITTGVQEPLTTEGLKNDTFSQDDSSSSPVLSTGASAAIGTIVPVFFFAVVGVVFLIRRRKKKQLMRQVHLTDVKVLEMLGEGNFGSVYKGIWQGTVLVALKKLKSEDQFDDFRREVTALYKLSHPNIVQLFGIFTSSQGDRYICTEFMSLGNCHSRLFQAPRTDHFGPSFHVFLRIFEPNFYRARQAAAGMLYLSSKNIVHCDLALRNLLVAHSNTHEKYLIKVADFGLAKMLGKKDEEKFQALVPIRWSAIEVIDTQVVSTASDVWSFGIVLYEVFSYGTTPYSGMKNEEVIEKIRNGHRLDVPEGCPDALGKVVIQCWNREPSLRPSFAEIVKVLNGLEERVENHLAVNSRTDVELTVYN